MIQKIESLEDLTKYFQETYKGLRLSVKINGILLSEFKRNPLVADRDFTISVKSTGKFIGSFNLECFSSNCGIKVLSYICILNPKFNNVMFDIITRIAKISNIGLLFYTNRTSDDMTIIVLQYGFESFSTFVNPKTTNKIITFYKKINQ